GRQTKSKRDWSSDVCSSDLVLEVRSVLGYHLSFQVELTSAEAPHWAHLAVSGDLRGTGSWTAEEHDGRTSMQIVWCVVTDRKLQIGRASCREGEEISRCAER